MKSTIAVPVAATLAAVANAQLFPDCVHGPLSNTTVCNVNATPLQRATVLTGLMTLAEKIAVSGSSGGPVSVPRLGLPDYWWWNEALHGVASSPGVQFNPGMQAFNSATSFPQPILMSAAFDDQLISDVATVVSTEARAFNNYATVNGSHAGLDFWTPNINPFRDPRWGRGQETPGEDPFRTSEYVRQLIPGLQGGLNPKYPRIAATCKHYVAYDIEDWEGNDRYGFNAVVDDQDLAEYYMPPFESCVRDSNVLGIMCSYNAYNGVPTCASPYLLQTVLRDFWNFTDEAHWVTSDCDAVQNIYNAHYYEKDGPHAAAAALNAGTDYDCGQTYPGSLMSAYTQGLFNESTLDRATIRRYSLLVKLGYFDPASIQPYRSLSWSDVNTPASQQLAYKAAVEGITLLKNDGTLPLSTSKPQKIALIGPWANATTMMQGNYQGIAPYLVSPLQAISAEPGVTVLYAPGIIGQSDSSTVNMGPVTAAAADADVIIYMGGIDESIESEGMDRINITWPAAQITLINELATYGKPYAVFQFGGGQVDSTFIKNKKSIGSLVWGGYPGQDGGQALADIIFGKVAPAGRLPASMYPGDYVNEVPMTDMALRPSNGTGNTTSSPGRTYQWYPKTVYPFGYGKHYTTFKASISVPGPTISSNVAFTIAQLISACRNAGTVSYVDQCPFRTFSIDVTNTGGYTSDYSALLFISGNHGPTPLPLSRLGGYTRISSIGINSHKTADIALTLGNLARFDAQGRKVLYPGTYKISVDTTPALASLSFTLTGPAQVLEDWPTPPTPVAQQAAPVLSPSPLPSGYKWLGCYVENSSGPRQLAYEAYDNANNTPQLCATTCKTANYTISGTEYSSQCWCADAVPSQAAASTQCNMACTGDAYQPCGGTWRADVVQYTG